MIKKITILSTTKNSWFLDYKNYLFKNLPKNKNYKFKFCGKLKNLKKSDIVFIVSSNRLLKNEDLNKSKFNVVIHGSDLPKGIGHSPWTWAIIKGDKFITLTMFLINPKKKRADSGDVLLKKRIQLKGTELVDEIRLLIIKNYIFMIKKYLKNSKKIIPYPQKGKATYSPKRKPTDQELNTNKSLISQFNILRIADNKRYPAFFTYKGKKYVLKISKKN